MSSIKGVFWSPLESSFIGCFFESDLRGCGTASNGSDPPPLNYCQMNLPNLLSLSFFSFSFSLLFSNVHIYT